MKTTTTLRLVLLAICLLCAFCTAFPAWAEKQPDAIGSADNTIESAADSRQTAMNGQSLDLDKYDYSKISEQDQNQILHDVASEDFQSNSNQLVYDFRAKQEAIRFYEVILLAVMSLFALAIVLKYMKDSKTCQARDMLNGTGLVLVIFATVLVIIIANVEIQLTAAMGVLGGIAGYLFGTLRSSQGTGGTKKVLNNDAVKTKPEFTDG